MKNGRRGKRKGIPTTQLGGAPHTDVPMATALTEEITAGEINQDTTKRMGTTSLNFLLEYDG